MMEATVRTMSMIAPLNPAETVELALIMLTDLLAHALSVTVATLANLRSTNVPAIHVTTVELVLTWWDTSHVHVPSEQAVTDVRTTRTIVLVHPVTTEVNVSIKLEVSPADACQDTQGQDVRAM